jgi:hypothetical protein
MVKGIEHERARRINGFALGLFHAQVNSDLLKVRLFKLVVQQFFPRRLDADIHTTNILQNAPQPFAQICFK